MLVLTTIVYAAAIEPARLVVNTTEIQPRNWPKSLDGLRVAVISDIHAGSLHVNDAKLARLVELTNRSNPDLVLLLGDYVIDGRDLGGRYLPPEYVAPRLEDLDAPLGVYSVLGNHEWDDGGYRSWRAFEEAGIAVLENDVKNLRWHGTRFAIAGFSDAREGRPDVIGTLANTKKGLPVLGMTHSPNVFVDVPPRVALTLAGHTHGGQLNLPLFGRVISRFRGETAYLEGAYRDHGRNFFVTVGVGTSALPLRLRESPEIALLILRSGPA